MEKKSDFVVYKGVRYTFQQNYYKVTLQLHRKVWEDHFGEIPKDHHIHHKNGDTRDNRIENLECIHRLEHLAMHNDEKRMRYQVQRIHCSESRARAREWYNSKKGRKVQSSSSKKGWAQRKPVSRRCIICGKLYLTLSLKENKKYCSNRCACSSQRSKELVTVNCTICGSPYQTRNRPGMKGKTCSYKCRGVLQSRTKSGLTNDIIPTIN